jgi:pyruvate formate lyase activating enzyme
VHLEITTLLVQELNSDEKVVKEIAKRILNELGEFTPFHVTRFFPQYKSHEHGYFDPTPLNLLHDAYKVAKDVGLKYVYLGNLPTTNYENTYCPKCSKLVIKRKSLGVKEIYLDSQGHCKYCGFQISKM